MSDNMFADTNGIEELIGQAVGAGSMCWVGGTGDRVFDSEHAAFVANCIALSADTVWMSGNAGAALSQAHREQLAEAGFRVETVALDAIEAAGGSLRCCIGEIY